MRADGELSVLMTDISDAPRARSAVAALISRVGSADRAGSAPQIRVRPALYTFLQLAAWRDAAAGLLFPMPWWTFLDLNEGANRIDVGVLSPGYVAEAVALLSSLGIPATASNVMVRGLPQANNTLLSRMRPLRGGLGVGPPIVQGGFEAFRCTMAVVAKWGGVPVILTNSHCTETDWGLDSHQSWFSQPFSPGHRFGPEHFDRTGRVCGSWNLAKCRRADIALYSVASVDMLPGESSAYTIGQIARPVASQAGSLGTLGTIVIDTLNPLQVVGVREFPIQGEIVHRIGARSGWQFGAVTQTCADVPFSKTWWQYYNRYFLCQSSAETNSNPGDSGGPVFIYLGGSEVLFAGINWGNPGGTSSYFSSVQQIRSELYQNVFEFYVGGPPPPPPPPAYSLSITGPSDVLPQVSCTWHASTDIPDPEYYWLVGGNVVGTGEGFTWSSSSSFELVLEIQGGGGVSAQTSTFVTVSSQANECFDQ